MRAPATTANSLQASHFPLSFLFWRGIAGTGVEQAVLADIPDLAGGRIWAIFPQVAPDGCRFLLKT